MPYIRKYKKPARKKNVMKGGLIKKVQQMDRKLKKIDLPELKYYDNAIQDFKWSEWDSSFGNNNAATLSLNCPILGTGVGDRIGDQIRVHKMEMSFTIFNNITQDIPYDITIMLCKENIVSQPSNPSNRLCYDYDFVAPAPFLTGLSTRSFRSKQDPMIYRVLKTIKGRAPYNVANPSIGDRDSFARDVKVVINKPFTMQYYNGVNTGNIKDLVQNGVLVLFKAGGESDGALGGQLLECRNFQYRFHFTDC